MKRWKVERWVDGDLRDTWEFESKINSLYFYNKKINNINKERTEKNRKATKKYNDNYEWDYIWIDTEGTQRLHMFKTWRGVKEENEENWTTDED